MNVSRLVNTVNQLPSPSGNCSACRCLPSINFGFLRTREGIVKILEIVLGFFCQKLLTNDGFTYSMSLGSSYTSFLSVCSSGVMTSFILLVTYMLSSKSFQLIRQSLFEILFNGIVSLFYISSSCYLAFAIHTFLYPVYKFKSLFQLFPEMSLTYTFGLFSGVLHGYDCWLAYKTHH